jgi:hypothetical protein
MKQAFYCSALLIILLYGCAGVKLYTDQGLKNPTGLKFYYPKPFLLVERNPAKDVAIKTTVIYLPDLNNPVFAKVIRGMGSNDFKIALENGALLSYGIATDTRIPETISAAGGLLSGVSDILDKARGRVAGAGDLQEVKSLIDRVETDIAHAGTHFPVYETENQKATLQSAHTEIQLTQTLLAQIPLPKEALIESLDKVIGSLKEVQCNLESKECKDFNAKFITLIAELTKAREKIQPTAPENSPSFELYEIKMDKDGISYKLIKPAT